MDCRRTAVCKTSYRTIIDDCISCIVQRINRATRDGRGTGIRKCIDRPGRNGCCMTGGIGKRPHRTTIDIGCTVIGQVRDRTAIDINCANIFHIADCTARDSRRTCIRERIDCTRAYRCRAVIRHRKVIHHTAIDIDRTGAAGIQRSDRTRCRIDRTACHINLTCGARAIGVGSAINGNRTGRILCGAGNRTAADFQGTIQRCLIQIDGTAGYRYLAAQRTCCEVRRAARDRCRSGNGIFQGERSR